MFNKHKNENTYKVETILGENFCFKGVLETDNGSLRIDGHFEGDLKVGGNLVIGESGAVEGTINAKNVMVAGRVRGKIIAQEKLELAPSAKVFAETKMNALVVEDGAVFQGQCEPLSRENIDEQRKVLSIDTDKIEKNKVRIESNM